MDRENKYTRAGLTVFCTAGAIIIFYDTLFGSRVLPGLAGKLLTAVAPILYGAFMAYLLAPLVDVLERWFFSAPVARAREKGRFCAPGVRAVSVALTWAIVGVLLYLLVSVLLPELYKSVIQLASNAETYYKTVSGWIESLFERFPAIEPWVNARMNDAYTKANDWLQNQALNDALTVVRTVGGGVKSAVGFLKNLLIGIIVSVYLLATKERSAAYGKKAVCALFSKKNAGWVLRGARRADGIFSGFVRGKLLDSLIIGILCFIGCSILKFPYTPLISAFVGATNIIPFFGPFLGAIPSAFLILLVSPLKALYFLIFVLALQQLDGNVIGPKILGGQTGLSSLWVIIAILVGGSFFGIPGMFFGVPVCACLYCAVDFLLSQRLRRRHLPEETEAYGGDLPHEGAEERKREP